MQMVKIRLMRMGATKRPFYRVVVADSRSPRDGRFIENIGKYHPLEDPSIIEIDQERALYWLTQGAQPTGQVVHLLRIQGVWERFEDTKKSAKPKKKVAGKTKRASTSGERADSETQTETASPTESPSPSA
jgi:small subunit ribosomal protein S16